MSDGKVKTLYMRRESPWLAFGFVLALAVLFASTRLAPAEAGGEVVSPEAGLTVVLGAANLSIFYQPTAAGFHVVATAGSDNSDNVIRFVSTLKPGQETEISVPRAVGQSAIALRLHRNGDVLELLRPVS